MLNILVHANNNSNDIAAPNTKKHRIRWNKIDTEIYENELQKSLDVFERINNNPDSITTLAKRQQVTLAKRNFVSRQNVLPTLANVFPSKN